MRMVVRLVKVVPEFLVAGIIMMTGEKIAGWWKKEGANMFYLVIDLEMCKVPRDYRSKSYKYANETIQIGAVLLDDAFKKIGTLCQYVHPEYGVIDYFIENLTGIKNCKVKNAPKLDEALIHMIDWLGERDYKIYAWSESDRNQLLHEIKAKKITDERIHAFVKEEKWVDYQDVFTKRFELSRQLSLEEALGRAEIETEGRFHDGLDDAVNTAYLIEKLEMNPEYKLVSYEMPDKPSEHLCSTLGEIFAGLDLKLA